MKTWIVYRVVKDARCTDGQRWQAIAWVAHDNEEMARTEAKKVFGRYDQETLRLMPADKGYGWLV